MEGAGAPQQWVVVQQGQKRNFQLQEPSVRKVIQKIQNVVADGNQVNTADSANFQVTVKHSDTKLVVREQHLVEMQILKGEDLQVEKRDMTNETNAEKQEHATCR